MEEGGSLMEHMNVFNGYLDQLRKVDVKIDEEDKALLLLTSLPDSYDTLVTTLLYGKDTVSLEQVQSSLVSHCTQKRSSFEDGESAALAVQSGNRGKKSDSRSGWSNGSSSSSRGKGVQCYYCKEFGHVKRDCPLRKDKGKKCDDASSCNSLVVADDGDCLTVSEAGWTPMDASIFAGGGAMKITRGGKVLMKGEKCEGLYRLIGKTVYSTKVWKRCAQGSGYPRCESFAAKTKLCFQVADGCEGVTLVGREDGSSVVIVSSLVECGRALGILTKSSIAAGSWSLIAASHGLRLRLPQSLLRRLLEGYKKRELKEEVEREEECVQGTSFILVESVFLTLDKFESILVSHNRYADQLARLGAKQDEMHQSWRIPTIL
ncbi:hypothetical protein Acr_00g0093470 [Actinidia rufa]|uniref:CCHC-type domain-containing protein n=1 Tax=Actinidia rufa TaxID=165716 RepID=A0A7J0DYF0_9ERIC|nr:hypothetical protein Acr_00g0093470 [Actinidia rufa]